MPPEIQIAKLTDHNRKHSRIPKTKDDVLYITLLQFSFLMRETQFQL